jgi:hypothetical protein
MVIDGLLRVQMQMQSDGGQETKSLGPHYTPSVWPLLRQYITKYYKYGTAPQCVPSFPRETK